MGRRYLEAPGCPGSSCTYVATHVTTHACLSLSSSLSPTAFPSNPLPISLFFLFSHCRISQDTDLANTYKISMRACRNIGEYFVLCCLFVSDNEKNVIQISIFIIKSSYDTRWLFCVSIYSFIPLGYLFIAFRMISFFPSQCMKQQECHRFKAIPRDCFTSIYKRPTLVLERLGLPLFYELGVEWLGSLLIALWRQTHGPSVFQC